MRVYCIKLRKNNVYNNNYYNINCETVFNTTVVQQALITYMRKLLKH